MIIDTSTDFTLDTPDYWKDFWLDQDGIGSGRSDPDLSSRSLQLYHQTIWSRILPCGENMELKSGFGSRYLTWRSFRFGSDSIIVSYRYKNNRDLLTKVRDSIPDYRGFVEDFLHRTNTIGGSIIFPKHINSINQARGINPLVRDRWDLTLKCIKKYYQKEYSPLYSTLLHDKAFFDLFVDFKGYVDFFFLQDCVTSDYKHVKIWLGSGDFNDDPLPHTVDEYMDLIDAQLDFVEKRNLRIAAAFK